MAMVRWCDVWLCAVTTSFVLIPAIATTFGAVRKGPNGEFLCLFDSSQEQLPFLCCHSFYPPNNAVSLEVHGTEVRILEGATEQKSELEDPLNANRVKFALSFTAVGRDALWESPVVAFGEVNF